MTALVCHPSTAPAARAPANPTPSPLIWVRCHSFAAGGRCTARRGPEVGLRRQRSWLVVEPLPAYAPDLNPVEPLWSNLKGVELANLAGDTLDEVIAAAERGIQRIRHAHHLPFSFPRSCGLSLW